MAGAAACQALSRPQRPPCRNRVAPVATRNILAAGELQALTKPPDADEESSLEWRKREEIRIWPPESGIRLTEEGAATADTPLRFPWEIRQVGGQTTPSKASHPASFLRNTHVPGVLLEPV